MILLLVNPSSAGAQWEEEPLVTDRPDITESSSVVGHGRFQLEASTQFQSTDLDLVQEDIFSMPTLLRIGFRSRFEFRFGGNLFTRQDLSIAGEKTRASGLAPFQLGIKVNIAEGEQTLLRPKVAVIAQTEIPSGSSAFKVRRATGQIVLAADSDLTEALGMGFNIGAVSFETNAEEVRTGGLITIAFGYGFTDAVGAFIEFAGSGVGLASDDQLLILDGGFTYLFTPNVQVDVAGGIGLNDKAVPDKYITLGFSFRAHYLRQEY